MDSEHQSEEGKSNVVPQERVAVFLRQLKEEGGLSGWDQLCEELYSDLESADRIHRFAEHHERWPMPLEVNFSPLSVLIKLANEFHAVDRNHELLTAIREAETRVGWCPSPSQRRELDRLGRVAERLSRSLEDFKQVILAAFEKQGSMNWVEVAKATGYEYDHVRTKGLSLVKAGYIQRVAGERSGKEITKKGREELRRLNSDCV